MLTPIWQKKALENPLLHNLKPLAAVAEAQNLNVNSQEIIVTLDTLHTFERLVFFNKVNLEKLTIDMEIIPAGLCSGFTKLQDVKFSDKVVEIGPESFAFCPELANLKLPNNLVKIGSRAFSSCSSLKGSIALPNSLTEIGSSAFLNTECILKIKKNRISKLKISSNDKDWASGHIQLINTNEGLSESILNEAIPRELLPAYRKVGMSGNSTSYASSSQQHQYSNPAELKDPWRRSVSHDYGKAKYKQLNPDKAKDLYHQNGEEINHLRIIVYEQQSIDAVNPRNGQITTKFKFYPYIGNKSIPWTNASGQEKRNIRYAASQSDIDSVLDRAKYIFWTNEDDLPLIERDPQNPEINAEYVGKYPDVSEIDPNNPPRGYDPHNIYQSYKNMEANDRYGFSKFDTGDYNLSTRYNSHGQFSNRFKSDDDLASELEQFPPQNRYGFDFMMSDATRKLIDLEKIAKDYREKYSSYRRAIQDLNKRSDDYSQEELQALLQKYNDQKKTFLDYYNSALSRLRKEKDKVLVQMDSGIKQLRDNIINYLRETTKFESEIYRLKSEISNLKQKSVVDNSEISRWMAAVSEKSETINKIKKDLEQAQALNNTTSQLLLDDELKSSIQEYNKAVNILNDHVTDKLHYLEADIISFQNEIKSNLDNLKVYKPKTVAHIEAEAERNQKKQSDDVLNYIEFYD